jgi:hypothetical protein
MPLPASAPDSKIKKTNTKEIETYLIEEKKNISRIILK